MKLLIAIAILFNIAHGQGAPQGTPQDTTRDTKQPPVKVLRRAYVRHASPKLIWMILTNKTNFLTPPEPNKDGPQG